MTIPSFSKMHGRAISIAEAVMRAEAEAIAAAAGRLDHSLTRAVDFVIKSSGKLVVSGIGKSGHVGRKLAGTLCSCGTPSVFLHAAEALHGDLGVYTPGDPTLLISKSGTTVDLLRLLPTLRQLRSPLIAIVGNPESPLARAVDCVLDGSVRREADESSVVPTSSTAVAMAIGDALAIALMEARGFTAEDFAVVHPGGQLGRNLHLKISDAMHPLHRVACVSADDAIRSVVVAMTKYPLGAACVISAGNRLEGLITDGDLRRVLQFHDDLRTLRASDVMTCEPIVVDHAQRLHDALAVMEDRESQLSLVPVLQADTRECLGLLRLHDVYSARV